MKGSKGITVHELRHVFVTDRQSDPSAPGPSMEAAARGMLHSSRMWTNGPYDLGRERRQVEQRAADMVQYRRHRLAQARGEGAGPGAGAGGGSGAAASAGEQGGSEGEGREAEEDEQQL